MSVCGFRIGELDGVPLLARRISQPENPAAKSQSVVLGPLRVEVFPCKGGGFDVRVRRGQRRVFYHVDAFVDGVL